MGRTDLDAVVLTISRSEKPELGDVVLFQEGRVRIAGASGERLSKARRQRAGLVVPVGAESAC